MPVKNKEFPVVRKVQKKGPSKGEKTRQRILRAARKVFTTTSFRAAGIRMIAEEAGVRHPLVLHYFKSKTALFEAVVSEIQDEILEGHPDFFNHLRTLGADKRKALYLDGIFRQGLRSPDAYQVMLLNAVEVAAPDRPLPGLDRMVKIHERLLSLVSENVLEAAPKTETAMFMHVFTLVAVHFIGGRAFHRKALGLYDHAEYDAWVRQTVEGLFKPVLEAVPKGRPPFLADYMSRWPGKQEAYTPPAEKEMRGKHLRRGEITKKRIIAAALKVFGAHPYDQATIRMIGKAGNFDYSRIHHFFPTKASLFEAVIQDTFKEFLDTIESWQEGVAGMAPEEVFIHYLQKGLAYCFENRDAAGMTVINIAHYDRYKDVSGFRFMVRVHSNMLKLVEQSVPPNISPDEVNRWLYTIVMVGYSFAGAPGYPASLMNLDPYSGAYEKYIFETLCFVFIQSLMTAS
ncbi:MAG: TetR/AcrR family transcriptional regulator [Thermodesulfobacteriota bacterium]|nr:TetR/AcrR family transcriptional regulator [Thermodesulfobacteriota bacterium]